MLRAIVGLALAVLLSACGGGLGPMEALRTAVSGEVVTLPAGDYVGPLRVPAGVSLFAEDAAAVRIDYVGPGAALIVEAGSAGEPTRVRGLQIESTADAALVASGDGVVQLDQLVLRVQRGVGIAAEGLASLSLAEVQVIGSVSPAQVSQLVFPVDPARASVVGVALSRVRRFEVERVTVSGFGGFAAVAVDSSGTVRDSELYENVGVGLRQDGGHVTLQRVSIHHVVPGERGSAILAYGLVVSGEGRLSSDGLSITDNRGFGLLQSEATATHQRLEIGRNQDVGLWVQNSVGSEQTPVLQVHGAGNGLHGNRGGGVFAIKSGPILVSDTTISATVDKPVPVGETGLTQMADGIQVDRGSGLRLERVKLIDNARVGVLLSGMRSGTTALSQVDISGRGQFGMVVQRGGQPDPDWQINRTPALQQADQHFGGELDIAAALGSVPSVTLIRQRGLVGRQALIDAAGSTINYTVNRLGLTPEDD